MEEITFLDNNTNIYNYAVESFCDTIQTNLDMKI